MLTEKSFGFGPLSREPNPCIRTWGVGPDGKRCKTCVRLVAKRYHKTYYKCEYRRMSNSEATDHRVSWNACGKYEAVPDAE